MGYQTVAFGCLAAMVMACAAERPVGEAVADAEPSIDRAEVHELPVFEGTLVFEANYVLSARGHLSVGVTVTNTGQTELTGEAGFQQRWWFEAYETPDRAGEPLWVGYATKGWGASEIIRLPSGMSQNLDGGRLALVDAVTPGTYYLSAAMLFDKPHMRTAILAAGRVDIPASP